MDQQTENAATSAKVGGVQLGIEAAKLLPSYPSKSGQNATSFFWDDDSNSVQPVALLGVSL